MNRMLPTIDEQRPAVPDVLIELHALKQYLVGAVILV